MPEFDDGDEQRDRLLRIVKPLKSLFLALMSTSLSIIN
jgi:hypothetical protein